MSKQQAKIERVRMETREEQIPYFTDHDIEYYLTKYHGDVNRTIYDLLIIKSEDSSITVSGWTTGDTSSYFKRLASKYRPSNSGMLEGV